MCKVGGSKCDSCCRVLMPTWKNGPSLSTYIDIPNLKAEHLMFFWWVPGSLTAKAFKNLPPSQKGAMIFSLCHHFWGVLPGHACETSMHLHQREVLQRLLPPEARLETCSDLKSCTSISFCETFLPSNFGLEGIHSTEKANLDFLW